MLAYKGEGSESDSSPWGDQVKDDWTTHKFGDKKGIQS
jgi:hypothetical protein